MDKEYFGFSLVEILITIAIVGLLASIAVPSYKSYSVRSQVVETINFISGYKNSIAISLDATGSLPTSDINFDYPSYLSYINWSSTNSYIVARFATTGYEPLADGEIIFTPTLNSNGHLLWLCGTSITNAIKCDFLPNNCQQNCDDS